MKKSKKFSESDGYGVFRFRVDSPKGYEVILEPGNVWLQITQDLSWDQDGSKPETACYQLNPKDLVNALREVGFDV